MKERAALDNGSKIFINVDHTSMEDYFLIMTGSITIGGRAVPLYFTMRNYPKKKGKLNQKKMEQAFIKGLRHVLSAKYQYVIVADRGFGNERFITLCKDYGFNYVIRSKSNLNVEYKNKPGKLGSYRKNSDLKSIYIKSWGRNERIIVHRKGAAIWWVISDLEGYSAKQIAEIYAERFKIEKCFQDQKSSGFDIENSKIRKYSRVKRLLFCISLSQMMLVFLGDTIKNKKHNIKKNFPLHTDLISAYSNLEGAQCASYMEKQS